MSYSEMSYPFPGETPFQFAHIAAMQEQARLQRKLAVCREAYRNRRH